MLFRKKFLVHGSVQGVGFRFATQKQAQKIGGVYGFVKNLSNGTVEIEVEGEEKTVDDLIAWCYRGSAMSEVEKVEILESQPIDKLSFKEEFTIVR